MAVPSARHVIMLWRAVQLTWWLAVRVCNMARAAHTVVSRAGLSCFMQVLSTQHVKIMQWRIELRRAHGMARNDATVGRCAAHLVTGCTRA